MSFDWEEDQENNNNNLGESASGFDFGGEDTNNNNSEFGNDLDDTPAPSGFSDSGKLYEWRLEHEEKLKQFDSELEQQKREQMEKAKKEREEMYQEREETKQKEIQKRKQHEEEVIKKNEQLLKSENPWERVSAFIDFKAVHIGDKDTTRMKKILISMKGN